MNRNEIRQRILNHIPHSQVSYERCCCYLFTTLHTCEPDYSCDNLHYVAAELSVKCCLVSVIHLSLNITTSYRVDVPSNPLFEVLMHKSVCINSEQRDPQMTWSWQRFLGQKSTSGFQGRAAWRALGQDQYVKSEKFKVRKLQSWLGTCVGSWT